MKNSRKSAAQAAAKSKRRSAVSPSQDQRAPGRKLSRRDALHRLRDWGLIGLVAGAGVWWLVDDVRADIREHDLTRIGAGKPVVVQIHDPQCPTCRALQREARAAMEDFEDGALEYVVANIRSAKGRALARAHGVGHVTLLLFDGRGNRLQTLKGMRDASALRAAFRRHVRKSAGG